MYSFSYDYVFMMLLNYLEIGQKALNPRNKFYFCTCKIRCRLYPTLMAYSHSTGLGPGQIQGRGLRAMGPKILYRNVYARQEKELGSIVFYSEGPLPCTCPGLDGVQCEQAKMAWLCYCDTNWISTCSL